MSCGCTTGYCEHQKTVENTYNTTVLCQPSNSVLRLDSESILRPLPETFPISSLQNVKEVVLFGPEIQEIPDSFTSNLQNVRKLILKTNNLCHVPDNIYKLLKLEMLIVAHNDITYLPDGISTISNLKSLDASHNRIAGISDGMCYLQNLRNLDISNNMISKVPDEIFNLIHLEFLNLSHNTILSLPGSFGQLKHLAYLNLSFNSISQLPKEFSFFQLRTLNLSHNNFSAVPDCIIVNLPNMSALDLSHNSIAFFDSAPKCVSKLVTLDLSYNVFHDIPPWLFGNKCKCLMELNISYNKTMIGPAKLSSYSLRGDKVGVASKLKYLNASNCCLTSTSLQFLHGLEALEELILGNKTTSSSYGNILLNFPITTFSTCKNLKHLNLNGVTLTDFPEDVETFSEHIQTLDISNNTLYWLPSSFCSLTTLIKLRISNNQLALLPLEFGQLALLEELQLNGNKLQSLPDSCANLSKLNLLDLYDNLFEEIPEVIMELKGLEALDLEWNYLSFTNLTDQPSEDFVSRYWRLKQNLRLNVTEDRMDSMRPECAEEEEEEEYFVSSSSSSLAFSDCEESGAKENKLPCDNIVSDGAKKQEEEENWDLTDDLDSNFDPHYVRWLPSTCATYQFDTTFSLTADNFSPCDIHAKPIRHTRKLHQPAAHIAHEEGQFEDADPLVPTHPSS